MVTKKEIEIGGKTLSLETGKLALQADGSVMVRYGDSMVLATVVASLEPREDRDYFPLQIEYRERTAAAVFQKRGEADGEGDSVFPPDRPSSAPDVSRRV